MDPATGAFISMDTYQGNMHDPVSLHKYIYANANPITYTDPTGLFSLAEMASVTNIMSTLQGIQNASGIWKVYKTMVFSLQLLNLANSVRYLYMAVLTGDPLEILLALADVAVSFASFLNICKLSIVGQVLLKSLVLVDLGNNFSLFLEALGEGDALGAISAGFTMLNNIIILFTSCFTGDTLVAVEDGFKRIDEIEAGDYVWAYDVETGETELKEVLDVFVKQNNEILYLETSVGNIDTTTNHPFYVIGKGWVAAGDLTIGDEVYTIDGGSGFVIGIKIYKLDEPIVVYNFEVEGFHTYFVGMGILVHNNYTKHKIGKDHAHHLFPQQFRSWFKAQGIMIDDYLIKIDAGNHNRKPNGLHTGSDNWNAIWKKFKTNNPTATYDEMMDQLLDMLLKAFS